MSESEFKVWACQAAVERDIAIEQVNATIDTKLKAQIVK